MCMCIHEHDGILNKLQGVDIPDIQVVILYGLPTSLLQYYQVSW